MSDYITNNFIYNPFYILEEYSIHFVPYLILIFISFFIANLITILSSKYKKFITNKNSSSNQTLNNIPLFPILSANYDQVINELQLTKDKDNINYNEEMSMAKSNLITKRKTIKAFNQQSNLNINIDKKVHFKDQELNENKPFKIIKECFVYSSSDEEYTTKPIKRSIKNNKKIKNKFILTVE